MDCIRMLEPFNLERGSDSMVLMSHRLFLTFYQQILLISLVNGIKNSIYYLES